MIIMFAIPRARPFFELGPHWGPTKTLKKLDTEPHRASNGMHWSITIFYRGVANCPREGLKSVLEAWLQAGLCTKAYGVTKTAKKALDFDVVHALCMLEYREFDSNMARSLVCGGIHQLEALPARFASGLRSLSQANVRQGRV